VSNLADVPAFLRRETRTDEAVFHVLDARAACGAGYLNADYPEVMRALVMTAADARKKVGSANRGGSIQILMASGTSMAPTIAPEDLLFVETAVTDYQGEGIYLIRHDRELLCKRLSMVGRVLTVSSDDGKTPAWSWQDRPEGDAIVGRVVCVLPMSFKKL
jgi:phage repressor protein C with HTH and peptisase S24 domain